VTVRATEEEAGKTSKKGEKPPPANRHNQRGFLISEDAKKNPKVKTLNKMICHLEGVRKNKTK